MRKHSLKDWEIINTQILCPRQKMKRRNTASYHMAFNISYKNIIITSLSIASGIFKHTISEI
jgi:hypothetical protein